MARGDERERVQSTQTSIEVIHVLQELGPARLSDVADRLEIAESTAHRHLNTLQDHRYVSRDGEHYRIGLRFLRLGEAARTRDPAYAMARSYVRSLAEETQERAQFVVEEHGLGTYLYMETGSRAVRVGFGVGRQIHLHCSSAGKSILAQYARERVDEILDRWGLPGHTEHTITDRTAFYEELDAVRERGYAFNREEHVEGLNAVAVPVKNGDSVLGALAVAGPSHRLKGKLLEEEIPNTLLASGNELELNVAYSASETATDLVVE